MKNIFLYHGSVDMLLGKTKYCHSNMRKVIALNVSQGLNLMRNAHFSTSILSIFRNQKNLLKKYQTIVDNHKDVMSFIVANKDKSPAELKAEAARFDKLHINSKEKISVKLKQYQQANTGIQAENARLAAELLLQGAKLAIILKDNLEEMLKLEGIAMLINAHKTNKGYELAQARIHMSNVANDFISEQKAVLDITKEIQKILDTKL